MAANYLHGVETLEMKQGTRTIQVVKSAVIGLVGTAPSGEKNTPILVNSEKDAAQFGSTISGFSIPGALEAIFNQGAGTVIVVNVFDQTRHTTALTDESLKVENRALKLTYPPLDTVIIKDADGNPADYVQDVDYSIDPFGNFKALTPRIADGIFIKFSYKRLDETKITASDIIGEINPATDQRTGLKCLELAYNLFGFSPKIIITPTFSDDKAVAAELISTAEKLRAICYLDAPYATTVQQAIEGRGPGGTINFNTSSSRAQLLYPMLKTYNVQTNSEELFPYSAFLAGVRAKVDHQEGYWVSESNHEIKGITGIEREISAGISNSSSDANLLNEKGITTVFNSYGTGYRTWGNRSAAFPTDTSPDNFIAVRRTADVINESIEQACLQFVDQPITQGWIDSVRETVNAFLRTLQGRGAIIDGVCKYLQEDNPPTQLAQGHVTFYVDFMPPTPAERISFTSLININYLSSLK